MNPQKVDFAFFRHSVLDTESSLSRWFWIPAPVPDPDPGFAGMTAWGTFYEAVNIEGEG
jgi:hypothetical protein